MPLTDEQASVALHEAVDLVQEYQGSEAMRNVADMLDRMVELYRIQLTDAEPDDVPTLQTAHKQCVLLRKALAKDGDVPTIL